MTKPLTKPRRTKRPRWSWKQRSVSVALAGVSYNVDWNKDYSIEASWLGGKPVGGA